MTAQADEPAERWEGETADALARLWGVPAVHTYRRVGSTNDVARRLAQAHAPAGTAVVADEQLAGRGREGFVWGGVHASYLHTHWAATPEVPRRLVQAAARIAEVRG